MNYPNTPGVKIEEVSLLPPSVAQVATSIPVFLGFTERQPANEVTRIRSLKEFSDVYGRPFHYKVKITDPASAGNPAPNIQPFSSSAANVGTYFLYEALQAYFLNGGGPCYVISVGLTGTAINDSKFTSGLETVEKLDEPTIVLFPEATVLARDKYANVVNKALDVAQKAADKFVLIDSAEGDNLLTTSVISDFRTKLSSDYLDRGAAYFPHLNSVFTFQFDKDSEYNGTTIENLRNNGSDDYVKAREILGNYGKAKLPPSAFMAGVYVANDTNRGVWKAPANASLQGVESPEFLISDNSQQELNVDPTSGKSINAIRTFTGRGTLVWGARTLAGNDNEWRYISVRRLFLSVEESIKKAISQFVFDNNDAQTWVKVKAMIKSYLSGIWQDGGLQGVSEKEAFFVNIGLDQTMSQQDVLEGKMIVKVGIAAVRPAEFIVLEFSHFVNQ